jgi:primosomal replication protein N
LSVNRVALTGKLTATQPLRHTPAGLPVLQCHIQHEGVASEAGSERKVMCRVEAVAIGEIASRLAMLEAGTMIETRGFLAQAAVRGAHANQLIFHITHFE